MQAACDRFDSLELRRAGRRTRALKGGKIRSDSRKIFYGHRIQPIATQQIDEYAIGFLPTLCCIFSLLTRWEVREGCMRVAPISAPVGKEKRLPRSNIIVYCTPAGLRVVPGCSGHPWPEPFGLPPVAWIGCPADPSNPGGPTKSASNNHPAVQ